MTNTNRTGFFIAPAANPTDAHAAGYDGNVFATEEEAEQAIADVAEALGTNESEWTVSEY